MPYNNRHDHSNRCITTIRYNHATDTLQQLDTVIQTDKGRATYLNRLTERQRGQPRSSQP